MPPVFIEHTQKHEPNLQFHTGPTTTISTYSFFPQIDTWLTGKRIAAENPNPQRYRIPGVPNTLVPGGMTGRGTAVPSALFPGQSQGLYIPPDPHIAVGFGHIVQVVNVSIAFYKKSDGSLLFQQRLSEFFGPVSTIAPGFDPRVFYDQHNDRFLVIALETNFGDQSKILVAASDDSDPNGDWNLLQIDSLVDVNGSDHWFDYPMPGYNADALVINGNLFAAGFGGSQSYVIPTAGLYNGTGSTVTGFFLASPSSIQGAGNMGSSFNTIYGVSVGFSGGSSARIFAWRDLTTTPTLVSTTVGVPSFSFVPPVPTRGGSVLSTISARILDANYRDGLMVAAHTVAVNGDPSRARIQWYEFAMGDWPTSGSPTLAQSGEIVLEGGDNAIQPAINKNVFGDITILFTRSSTQITADTMIASRVVSDPEGTIGAPVQIASSVGVWFLFRWGDYFAVVTDPNDDATFWGNGQNINASDDWTTEIQSWTVTIGGGGDVGTNYEMVAPAANDFPTPGITYSELQGTHFAGELADVIASDNGFFDVDSAFLPGQGHYGSLRANFLIAEPASTVDELGITIESHVSPGRVAVGTLFAFNWSINSYQYVKVFAIKATDNDKRVIKIKKNPGDFVSSGGEVKLLIRAHDPFKRRGRNPEPFRLRVDLFGLNVKVL
ncbi:MAG: hypothetical protein IH945_04215 [Armatimonadetes bacterium]|nr:hypothetical protein [Armatimonadota bacterium]